MLTPQVKVGPRRDTTSSPATQPSPYISWGLGWGLQSTAEGTSLWHWGDNVDNKSYVVAFDKQRMGVVVFTNSINGLAIIREVIEQSVGGFQPALDWLNYESYKSPSLTLARSIRTKGVEKALADYRDWRTGRTARELINEAQMNRLGYMLLRGTRRFEDAIEIFKQNVQDHSESSNVYDSLGEAYMVSGNKELAIKNYQQSIELDPNNTGGREMLKKLQELP
jgi:tetratricopeptide (TPR) repeat protein